MQQSNSHRKEFPFFSERSSQFYDFGESDFIRNSKKAKSIIIVNQSRKKNLVHQVHKKEVVRRKYLDLASPKKFNIFRIKSQERETVEDLIIGSNHELDKRKNSKCFKGLKKDSYNLSTFNHSVNSKNKSFREGVRKGDKNLKLKPYIKNYKERPFHIKLDEDQRQELHQEIKKLRQGYEFKRMKIKINQGMIEEPLIDGWIPTDNEMHEIIDIN